MNPSTLVSNAFRLASYSIKLVGWVFTKLPGHMEQAVSRARRWIEQRRPRV